MKTSELPKLLGGSDGRLNRMTDTADEFLVHERMRQRAYFVGILANYVPDSVWGYCLQASADMIRKGQRELAAKGGAT